MSWLLGDGFDFYNTGTDLLLNADVWAALSRTPLIGTSTRFGIGRHLVLGNGGSFGVIATTVPFTNSSTIFVNMNIFTSQTHVGGGTTGVLGFAWKDGSAIQGGFYFRNGGDFIVTSGAINGTPLATSTMLVSTASTWTHIGVKIVVHNTAGSVELRINDNTSADFLATGLNTRNGTSNFYANNIDIQGTTPNSDACDDFYVFNDQGAAPNTFQGDVYAVQQVPTSDVAVSWTRNTGTNNCLAVDDGPQDGDATYVATNTLNDVDTYAILPLTTIPSSIVAVVPRMLARMDSAGPHTVGAYINSGGTIANLANLVCTTAYQYRQGVFTVDPHTSAPWSGAAVNALLLSLKDVA